ncbi:hypothetical protein THARTR1_04120 [Trichoderma harzianum]|uniref:Transmembrane protein n=1 Tax=Trichoderma harzianum TaxID=5544 RepID=A0A2K0UCV4_TRIHA|nr:hypothetical protein THARTR1_04120 [Trichoderma harzianum]
MAPPTATATEEEHTHQQSIIKMNVAPAVEEEELECQLDSLSRGLNPLRGTYDPLRSSSSHPWIFIFITLTSPLIATIYTYLFMFNPSHDNPPAAMPHLNISS